MELDQAPREKRGSKRRWAQAKCHPRGSQAVAAFGANCLVQTLRADAIGLAIEGMWPFLQDKPPVLQSCTHSIFSVGNVFSLQLWPELLTFAARPDASWEKCLAQAVLQGDESYFFRAAFLRAIVRQSLENGLLPLLDKQWQLTKIVAPTPRQKPLPVESWFKNTESRAGIRAEPRDQYGVRYPRLNGPGDLLSRLEGKPLEQVFGNYQGRVSERRTDPFDKNAR